jgi:hypothetical protein
MQIEHQAILAELISAIELKHDGRAPLCGPFRRRRGCPALARGAGVTRRG